jgi:hypothetical protein
VSRARRDERGVALVAVMSACSLLLALGLSLALTTTIEVGIAANHRDGVQALHAADAALERAMADLAATADWNAVLAGAVRSRFSDGGGVDTLPDGSELNVEGETSRFRCGLAACGGADMDRVTALRPWGRNNPRWTVFASGTLADLLSDAELAGVRAYVVVWIGDDAAENDAQPLRDGGPPAIVDAANPSNPGRGAVWVHARAYAASGARRSVEAVVERDARWPGSQLRVRVWRETT